ncbi:hypothetical protein LPJGGPFB_05284 [Ensifer adhaerens]|uniref:hypothetical protein n=1 Tax=Ensifer adhaerens TaxID=106592 RepID=UPI001568FBC8|nr:hypothetical protein [Ensifer adhaerens]NRP22025.1 hypothetical protein [Ensifer adhaerens]
MPSLRQIGLTLAAFLVSAPTSLDAAERPEEAVYQMVRAGDPETIHGIAVLLNAEQGVFLTAGHLTTANDMRLRRGDQLFSFEPVMQGNNIGFAADDWAILRVRGDEWEDAQPLPDLPVLYGFPNATSLSQAVLFKGPTKATFPSASVWEGQSDSEACNERSVILIEASQYDHGDSGSPVFITGDNSGVAALTSRFQSTIDQLSDRDRRMVELFYELNRENEDPSTQQPLDAETLRTLIKDHILVKVVPTKCVLDAIVAQYQESLLPDGKAKDFAQRFRKHLRKIRDEPGMDLAARRQIVRRTYDFIEALNSRSFNWLELISLYDAYFDEFNGFDFTASADALQITASLLQASIQARVEGIQTAFVLRKSASSAEATELRSISNWVASRPAEQINGAGAFLPKFLEQNKNWSATEQRPLNVLGLGQAPVSNENGVLVGAELAEILSDASLTSELSPEVRAFTTDLATTLLVGYKSSDGRQVTPKFDSLAKIVRAAEAFDTTGAISPATASRLKEQFTNAHTSINAPEIELQIWPDERLDLKLLEKPKPYQFLDRDGVPEPSVVLPPGLDRTLQLDLRGQQLERYNIQR